MVNSRSNYPSGDGSPSSLSSSTCYIENDCKIPYDSESMKLIRIARLRNIMKKAGMNENYEPDRDKIIKIFAYHNQILEFIENNDKCINISYNLAPTINGQTNINLFYYIIMGISFSGQYLQYNSKFVGEGLINLLENIALDIINITNVANSNIMRTIINSVNNHINPSTFGGRLANHTGKAMISGARKASVDAAILAFKTIGRYMENCIGKYRKYDIILTQKDFESIKELNLVSSNTSPKKAVFLVDKNEFEGNFDVYCPKAEGDALHEIKIIYFKKTAWQFPNDEEVREAKEAEEAFRQSS